MTSRAASGEPKRILWASYLQPEGFDLDLYRAPGTSIEEVPSSTAAADWASANRGARVTAVVIVAAYMPGLDYDPAQIMQSVRASCRTMPFVLSVRESGPLFRPSHYAFTAEFREICGHGTIVMDVDSAETRVARQQTPRKQDRGGKQRPAVSLEPRWGEIARQAVALATGHGRISPPVTSDMADEAMRLVRAMREPGSAKRPDTFGRIHKRVMIALSQPGASVNSADIAGALGYSRKYITNCYWTIATVIRGPLGDEARADGQRAQRASDFCKQLGRDYQDWLISFGIRSKLLPRA